MKIQKLFIGIFALTFMLGCAAKKLTAEDVTKKVETAREANSEAQEKSKEAVEARNQYTSDYKVAQVEKIDERLKNIDKKIKSIEKSGKNSSNEAAAGSLNNAVDALKKEKDQLNSERKQIENIKGENWQDNITEIDSVMNIINKNLAEVESSLEKFSEE